MLKNERTEVKLDALRLKDGKADAIAQAITKVIDEYNLWNAIKMITADTTSVNTGKKNGVQWNSVTESTVNKSSRLLHPICLERNRPNPFPL